MTISTKTCNDKNIISTKVYVHDPSHNFKSYVKIKFDVMVVALRQIFVYVIFGLSQEEM